MNDDSSSDSIDDEMFEDKCHEDNDDCICENGTFYNKYWFILNFLVLFVNAFDTGAELCEKSFFYLSSIDENVVLFILGVGTGGLFGVVFCGACFVAGLNILMEKREMNKHVMQLMLLLVYLWFYMGAHLHYIPIATLGACEIGYCLQQSLSNGFVSAVSAAMMVVSLNLLFNDSFMNCAAIMFRVFISSFQSLSKLLQAF